MEAGVPFALFSAVQLLALAAALGVAALGLTLRRTALPLAAGGTLLAVAHAVTGASPSGSPEWAVPAVLRAAGYALLALGFAPAAPAAPLVVAPLGVSGGPAAAAGIAAALAAAAALRGRGPVLAAGLALAAVAEAFAPGARTSETAALALLAARGVSSALLLAYVATRARRSVLGKVVGAILAGVLVLAIGAAAAVGSLVTRSLAEDQRRSIEQVGAGQRIALQELADTALERAGVLTSCAQSVSAGQDPRTCANQLNAVRAEAEVMAGYFPRQGAPSVMLFPPTGAARPLDAASVAYLAGSDELAEAMRAPQRLGVANIGVVVGERTRLVAFGFDPVPGRVTMFYGIVIGAERVDLVRRQSGYDATLFVGDAQVASTLQGEPLDRVVETYAGRDRATVQAEGSRPTVHFQTLLDSRDRPVAVLALSAPSAVVLESQRQLLSGLFVVTLAVAALVGAAALLLARRIVAPIRALTAAATRVSRGDLDVSAAVPSADEVGTLSRAFDTMTASLLARTEDLRRAAVEQAALATRLETVLDSMGDGLVIADATGAVTKLNPAARSLVGDDDVVGRPVAEVVAGVDSAGEQLVGPCSVPRAAAGVLRRSDGAGVPVALVQTPLRNGDGAVLVIRDTTRESEVERMKTEFLSNVSHELRTPLTPIRGYAEILMRPDLPPGKSQQYAGTILDSSLRMARVVDLLVDVAALEAGRVEPEVADVSVRTLVDARLDAWRARTPGRDFRRRIAAGLPDAHVDAEWFGKALDELIDNAVKYTDGPVTVTATPQGPTIRVTVRDTGPGIPADQMGTLFSDFQQVDGSATRSIGGLGLGLSFVRRVAEVVGFDVHVESTPRKGSAFSLDVPAVRPVQRPRRSPAHRAPRGRSR